MCGNTFLIAFLCTFIPALRINKDNHKVLFVQMQCFEKLNMNKDAYRVAVKLLNFGYKVCRFLLKFRGFLLLRVDTEAFSGTCKYSY